MDSLIVDLDKVLDDFEAEESTNKIPGKTSLEYSHFLAKHDDHSWEEGSLAPVGSAPNWKISKREVSSVDYGEPYGPTSHFDLSEADFAPSVLKQPDKFSSKLENVLTNGYDDLLKPKHDSYDDHEKMSTDPVRSGTLPCNNETMPLDPVRSGSLPCNNETMTINGFVDSLSASLSMHNSQMIDLHGCNTEAMTTNSGTNALANSGFDDTYCKVPIQVVDVFTPVSEEPQMSGFTTHEQSLLQNRLDLSKCSYKDTIEDNININFHETVPLHGVLESETSETVVSDEVGVQLCDGGSFNKENIGSLEIKQNCLGLNNEISLQIRNNHDNGMESHMQQVNKDNKKMDEGYDSYDCLGKDTQNDVTLMLREGQSVHPCPQTSDEHPSEHKTVFDHDKSFDQSTVVKPNEEIIEGSALNDACLEKVSNKDLDISLDDENNSKGVGFGQNIKVDDDDMDEYLKDIETPETSLNISNAHLSLNRLNDVHSFPSNFSLTEGELCVKRKRACEGTTNELEGEQIKVFAKDGELSGDSSKHEEDNCDQDNRTDWNSNTSHHNALNIQNICMLSVDGVIHKDSNNGLQPKDSVEQSLHDLKNNTSDEGKCIGQSCSDSKIEVLQEELESDKSISSQCDINIADSICDQTGRENSDWTDETTVMRRTFQPGISSDISRPRSWGPSGSDTLPITQQKRPNSLNLPQRGDFNLLGERSQVPYTFPYLTEDTESVSSDMVQNNIVNTEEIQASGGEPVEEGCEENTPLSDPLSPEAFPQETPLGQSSPMWIPDNEAPVCMGCETKFTFTKRRHHCRACGKVFCSACCNLKSRLQYMEYREARVCVECHRQITIAKLSSQTSGSPNPNNPSEYCSVIPPSQQASASSQPPSVLVPASALKREGSNKQSNEGKHVMFSDGIRPGGDLTELDGSDTANQLPPRRSGRGQKKVEKRSLDTAHRQVIRKLRSREVKRHLCLIPERGLPPIIKSADVKGDYTMEENPEIEKTLSQVKDKEAEPVMFALNSNLFVLVKILNLDCCVNRTCWCFTTKGMCNVGQDEIVFVLEVFQNEETIPMDVLRHFVYLYEEASKGNTVTHMGHTIFNQSFLDSRDHGGILYIRPTFQCLHKVLLPTPPYVFGILLQKWEIPWAKVFPLRLLLRLGAEYRYYPCPLISVRDRKPVFFEIGHTIMNLLADFRNFQYMLPQIKGVSIHMEDKKTAINFPRNRYDDLMKVVSNSNEHVMALGASFSLQADSHLVCIQNDDGNYQTQAINIQNKPRKVTGASFVVFNGALKTSSGLKAKSSIVEDGLMVQITPESMVALKQAMKDMNNYTIECGSVTTANPDEVVSVIWGSDDKNINIGVKSPIDDMSMDGVESIQIPNATDYIGEKQIIRWTDVYFIQNKDSGSTRWEPVDLSRLAETLSNATCIALTPHLEKLKDASLTKIGLRVNIEIEKVGYEIGANGERLPALYMNDLDNELIPVIHSAASQNRGGTIILELIFHIIV